MYPIAPLWETKSVRSSLGNRSSVEREWALNGWVYVEWSIREEWATGVMYYMLTFRRASPTWLQEAREDAALKEAESTPKP